MSTLAMMISMSELPWILSLIILLLGGGWFLSSRKNREIDRLKEQNRDIAAGKAKAEIERDKAVQEAGIAKATSDLRERVHDAGNGEWSESTDSQTMLSEEDKELAKDIMLNHRT